MQPWMSFNKPFPRLSEYLDALGYSISFFFPDPISL